MASITALAADNAEAHAAVVTLQNNLLPEAHRRVPLAAALEHLELFLAGNAVSGNPGRRPTINAALAAANPTTASVVSALLAEQSLLQAAPPPGVSPAVAQPY